MLSKVLKGLSPKKKIRNKHGIQGSKQLQPHCTLHILKRRSAVQAKHIHFISCAAHTQPLPCYISTRFSVKGVAKCCQRTPVQGKGGFEVCVRIPSQQESSTRA